MFTVEVTVQNVTYLHILLEEEEIVASLKTNKVGI